jgi:hypothetical protein
MSDFIRTRFFFIMVMISLSIAQGLVVHVGQAAVSKTEQNIPFTLLNHHP